MLRPKPASAEEAQRAGLADFVKQLGPRDHCDLVAVRSGAKTIFVIDEVDEEVGSRQADRRDHFSSHHRSRSNDQITKQYWVSKEFGGRFDKSVAPKPWTRGSLHVLVDSQRGKNTNLARLIFQALGLLQHDL